MPESRTVIHTDPDDKNGYVRVEASGVTVTITRSAGIDNTHVVFVDTEFEPDGSDGSDGLRVMVNDSDVFVGKPYEPKASDG